MMTISTFRLPFKNKSTGSDASDIEEDGDDLGSLPQFNKIAGAGAIPTAPPDDSEYGLSIPMSVSSMSFSASTAAASEIDLPALAPSRLAFNRYLADDDAPEIGNRSDEFVHADEFSAYLSRYSTFTDFTTNTTAINLTLTSDANTNADTNESGLFNDSTFSVITGFTADTDAAGLKTNAAGFSTDSTTSSTAPTPLVPNTATGVSTNATATELNADLTLSTQLVPSEQAKTEGAAKSPVFALFAEPWLKLLSFASPVEDKDDGNTAERAIVGVSQSNPVASSFLPSEKMGREDILRMAIATALNLFVESESPNIAGCVNFYMDMASSTAAGTPSTPYRPDGANTSLVVRKACSDTIYQPPAPAPSPEETPVPVIAPNMSLATFEDKSRASRTSRASKASNGDSDGLAVVSVEYTETGKKTLAKLQEEHTEAGNKAKSPMFARTRSLFKKHPKATKTAEVQIEHTETEIEYESTAKDDEARDESIHELNTVNDDGPATETEVEHTETEAEQQSTTKDDEAQDESIRELNTVNDDGNVALRTEKFANDPAKSTRGLDTNGGIIKRRSSIWHSENPDVTGCVNFYTDMIFGSEAFATGVLLELEMNGVFPKAAEKFDALDEDSQIRFVNSHNRQLISRMSSGREKQVAFYHAFLHLVSASTLNAVKEVSTFDVYSACSATKESTENKELAAKKAVAKIIEADIIEELENDAHEEIPSLRSVMTDDNLSRFGVEMPYEQYQALQKSKSPFHFDFSKYVKAVQKARAHLSTKRATMATRKDQEHRSSTDEEIAPTESDQKKIAGIEAKPSDDISYDDDTVTRLLLETESEEGRAQEKVESKSASSDKREGGEMFSIPDCTNLTSMMAAAVSITKQDNTEAASNVKLEGGEMFSIPDCTNLVSMVTAAMTIKNDNERESKCQAKEEAEKKKLRKKKEKLLANEETEEKKPIEKEEAQVPEKKTGNAEAEDICMRILKERVKRKRKIKQARKKAIQEIIQQSRASRPTKAPNARSNDVAMQPSSDRKANKKVNAGKKASRSGTKVPPSKERRDQGGAVQNISSNKCSSANRSSSSYSASTGSRSSSSRTRTGSQRSYRKVSTGLNKPPRLVKTSE